ncbi:MAG: TonB-dependent receptor [Ginsengibacter sp.]
MDLKVHYYWWHLLPKVPKQTLKTMKLIAIILFAACIQVSARGYSQITLSETNTPLQKVFQEIQQQSGYDFVATYETFKEGGNVTVNVRNVSLQKAIEECLKGKSLTYVIIGKTVVVRAEEKTDHNTGNNTIALEPLSPPPVEIHGRVVNQKGDPLQNVSVLIAGTKIGTTTNSDGRFILTSPDDKNVVLEISSVGYQMKKVSVGKQREINVTLELEATGLNEVVVVGYGTELKKDLIGAVGSVSRKDFGDVSVSNASQLLSGKIAGVQVVNNSGDPGSGSQIVIRGTGSFTSVAPLYVIDGIQSDASIFNSLSPFDIQDIRVLKDASSVAIYGAQGANGVVIITTRHPKNGPPTISYDGYVGFSSPWKQLKMMDASQYTSIVKEWYENEGIPIPPRVASSDALVTKTDWQKEMFRTGITSEHHINIGGGSDHINYTASLGYTKQEGEVIGPDFQRVNFRVRLEEYIGAKKRIKLGQQLLTQYSVRTGTAPSVSSGLRMPPYIPTYDSTNLLGGFGIATSALDGNDATNPLIVPSLFDTKSRGLNNYVQLYGEISIINGLKFRSQIGTSFDFNQSYSYNPTYAANQLVTQNQINETYNYGLSYIFENYFTYNKQFGKHGLNVTLGNSYRDGGILRSVGLVGSDFANDQIHQIGVAKTVNFTSGQANSTARFISYFARINYIYNNKYILNLTGRRDATSLFSESNRVGYFPSVGLGWRLSEEDFLKKITFISDLKLRSSWGITGNSNIPGFSYQSNVWTGSGNSVVYPLGPDKALINGATVAVPSTPNLKWETTTTFDIGVDASFWGNKISLSAGYYKRNNKDLLVSVPLPPSAGYGGVDGASSSQLINAASAINKGFELTLSYSGKAGNLIYNINLNGTYNKNEVTSLGTQGAVPIMDGGFFDVTYMSRTDMGHPIGSFYGFVYDHVAIDQADVEKYNEIAKNKTGDVNAIYQEGLLPGDRIFKDVNGDGQITQADRTFLGSPIPKWMYGFNINLGFKQFDFMASLQGIAGVQIINGMKFYLEGFFLPFNAKTDVLNRWQKPGDITDIARVGQNPGTSANLRPSSWYVENGAYARIRNVTFGYTIPQSSLKHLSANVISNIRLYLTAQNLFTFTKYSGYDPEIGSGDFIFSRGIDMGGIPQARTFMVGVQVGF